MSRDATSFESRLRALTPAPGPNEAETLFALGRASAPVRWPWQVSSLLSVLVALGFAVAWWWAPVRVMEVERIVEVQVPVRIEVPVPVSPSAEIARALEPRQAPGELSPYLRLQDHLLRHGLDGLRVAPELPAREPVPTRSELLQNLGFSEGDF